MAKMQSMLSIIRRSHSTAAAESARAPASAAEAASAVSASTMRRVSESGNVIGGSQTEQRQNFWMRDPKTGNWIPENHFGDEDAADLRAKLLSKK